MNASCRGPLTLIALIMIVMPARAHHTFASVFDRDRPIELSGVVTKIEWMNPHTWFYIDVETASGAVESWAFELGSPNSLVRRGWRHDSLEVGATVTVMGLMARERPLTAAVRSVTLASGERLFGAQNENR